MAHDNTVTMKIVGFKAYFKLTKHTSYLTLTGMLKSVSYEYFGEKW